METIFILIIIACAVALEYFLYAKIGSKGVTYTAKLEKTEVFEGEEIILTEELANNKLLPVPYVKTEIVAPSFLDFGEKFEENKEGFCCIPSVFSLRKREKCRRVRHIKCTRRGMFEIGAASLYGSDIFGLKEFTVPVENAREFLTVLPTPLSTDDFYPENKQLFGDILIRRFICDDPFLINGAHEYSGREPMNSISWSASAREGKLMAVDREHTTSSRVLILLNFQRRDDLFAAAETDICELMIKAAAFAMEKAEEFEAEFSLSINVPYQSKSVAGSGEVFRHEQLRRLAAVDPKSYFKTEDFLRNSPAYEFTDVVLITPTISYETADYLIKLRNQGIGICAYTMNNEAEADFCSVITRRRKA